MAEETIEFDIICGTCRQPKAIDSCGLCAKSLCKKCTEAMPKDYFSFLKSVPEELQHTCYCGLCFDQHVAEAKEKYTHLLDQAEKVAIFYKKERNVPVVKQSKTLLQVKDCSDRNEALLRLAFFSAELKFDAVIHVELVPQKIRINHYQTTHWHATGYPARLQKFDLSNRVGS